MQRLVHVVAAWKQGEIEHGRALAEAKAIVDGDADRVVRVE